MNDPHRFDDIIDLPHHKAKNRKQMSMAQRAAQFSPFAALTGYDSAIKETSRLTSHKIELSEEEKFEINQKLFTITHHTITMTYFVKDLKKTGGSYQVISEEVEKVDEVNQRIEFVNGTKVSFTDILKIDIKEKGDR